VLESLDRAEAPLARAAHEDHIHRHMRAPEAVPVPLAPLGDDEELELSNRQVDDWLTCPLRYKYAHVLRVPLLPHHSVGYGLALHNAIRRSGSLLSETVASQGTKALFRSSSSVRRLSGSFDSRRSISFWTTDAMPPISVNCARVNVPDEW